MWVREIKCLWGGMESQGNKLMGRVNEPCSYLGHGRVKFSIVMCILLNANSSSVPFLYEAKMEQSELISYVSYFACHYD